MNSDIRNGLTSPVKVTVGLVNMPAANGLVDNKNLAYHYMGDFDAAMLGVVKSIKNFQATPVQEIWA